MLRSRKFIYCMIVLFMLFAVIVSGGCGGGSSGGAYIPSSEDNNEGGGGWDVPGGDTGGDNGGGGGGNDTTSPMTLSDIDGTWKIESGYRIISDDLSDRIKTTVLTCSPEKTEEFTIEMRANGNTYGSTYSDRYTMILSGKNVLGSGTAGGSLRVYFFQEPKYEGERINYSFLFGGGCIGYKPTSNTSYEYNSDEIEDYEGTAGWFEWKLKLIDSSTLVWSLWSKENENTMGSSDENYIELTLTKVK